MAQPVLANLRASSLPSQLQTTRGLRQGRYALQCPHARCRRLQVGAQFGTAAVAPPLAAPPAALERSSALQLPEVGQQQQLVTLQLPKVEGVQLPTTGGLQLDGLQDVDVGQAANAALQAVGGAAQQAVAPFDVFSGNALLDVMFWAVLLLVSYSVLVLGPRQ